MLICVDVVMVMVEQVFQQFCHCTSAHCSTGIALAMPQSRKRKCTSAAASSGSGDTESESVIDDFGSDDEGEDCSWERNVRL